MSDVMTAMPTAAGIPGFMEDAHGRLVPEQNVREIDKLRNDLVLYLVPRFREINELLKTLKHQVLEDIAAFVELSAERYDVKVGGKKGNISLLSYNSKYKVARSMADNIRFDEGMLAAEELINQCLTEWSETSHVNLRTVVDRAFRRDAEGNLSTVAILGLRRLKIDDNRWIKAMQAISDSMQVVYAKAYVRVYEQDEHGGWQNISLDFAAL